MIEPLDGANFSVLTTEELLGRPLNDAEHKYAPKELYVKGPMQLPLQRPMVSIVGSRKASREGLEAARTITKKLVEKEVVIISGLAEGIDTSTHQSAIDNGGKTIAVLGTPLNKVYPQKNSRLQEEIMRNHLAVSQFSIMHRTLPKDFVSRNRTMALISDATIIVEATDTSGSLHQGWEAIRLGRSLFIWESILHNPKLTWYKEMLKYDAMKLSDPTEVLGYLPSSSYPRIIDIKFS
jgi:DNA processing protein